MWLLMFISIQSVVLLFLHVSVIMCIELQMLSATTLFHMVPVRWYPIELQQVCSYPVLLLPLCCFLQDIRCTQVMFPSPSHSMIRPRYQPYFWFIPCYQDCPGIRKVVNLYLWMQYKLFHPIQDVQDMCMLFRTFSVMVRETVGSIKLR